MKLWVKMSTGLHKDRKMWKLSKDAQLVFFYLLSLAGAEDTNGVLPDFKDIGLELWFLKLSDKALDSILTELENSEIIQKNSDGRLVLKNFEKWQLSEKTKSEINRENYLKRKAKSSEIQSEFRLNSDEIQTEKNLNSDLNSSEIQKKFRPDSEKIQKNSDEIQTLEIDIDIDKEIDIEKEKEKDITSANAEVQNEPKKSEKKSLKPENHDFWKFAKENADLGEAFYQTTGIFPVKKEFGRWVNDLRDLSEAGITIDDLPKAVEYMQSQNITIGAPGSILKIARWLKTNPQAETHKESWTERAMRIESEMQNSGDLWGFLPEGDVIDV